MKPFSVDVKFNSNNRPRNRLRQQGGSNPYGQAFRPSLERLREYEYVANYDTTIYSCLQIMTTALVSSLEDITHVDPEIQAFLRYNLARMQDKYQKCITWTLQELILTTMENGYSVSENLMETEDGECYHYDVANYHPATIRIRTNKKGRLTEGEPTIDPGYKSGIYQIDTGQRLEQKLDFWRINYLCNESRYNNYYGRSCIEHVYKEHLLQETLIDMLLASLNTHSSPTKVIILPAYPTGLRRINANGEEELIDSVEDLERQLGHSLGKELEVGGERIVILPQTDKDIKPDAKILNASVDIGRTVLETVKHMDMLKCRGLLMPYFLVDSTSGNNSGESILDIYNRTLHGLYARFVVPLVSQWFHPLIRQSFTRESAKIAPTLPLSNATRIEDRVALMQVIRGLTEDGYFNPTNKTDWSMVRQMVAAISREQEPADLEFINDILIKPRLGVKEGMGMKEGSKKGRGNPGRPVGEPKPVSAARETERGKGK